eukprot:TRINITY_DN658_c0_g1_i4.p1 TRINITY_DN658_c0_g1~~TRINITY_DN658_c0_g1_i4.p1  ORF type:complete len:196 (+),score=31.69 TRINITY_DN658_c0_g1_i4:160-747(+)
MREALILYLNANRVPIGMVPETQEKELLLKHGEVIEYEEGKNYEFKGAEDSSVSWDYKAFRNVFKKDYGRTVCGFLNSGEGGKLIFGIHDDGTVQGIVLNREERDHARLLYDNQIKFMYPPVTDSVGIDLVEVGIGRYVVIITVDKRENDAAPILYWFNKIAFIRSEASTEVMHPRVIVARIKDELKLKVLSLFD